MHLLVVWLDLKQDCRDLGLCTNPLKKIIKLIKLQLKKSHILIHIDIFFFLQIWRAGRPSKSQPSTVECTCWHCRSGNSIWRNRRTTILSCGAPYIVTCIIRASGKHWETSWKCVFIGNTWVLDFFIVKINQEAQIILLVKKISLFWHRGPEQGVLWEEFWLSFQIWLTGLFQYSLLLSISELNLDPSDI